MSELKQFENFEIPVFFYSPCISTNCNIYIPMSVVLRIPSPTPAMTSTTCSPPPPSPGPAPSPPWTRPDNPTPGLRQPGRPRGHPRPPRGRPSGRPWSRTISGRGRCLGTSQGPPSRRKVPLGVRTGKVGEIECSIFILYFIYCEHKPSSIIVVSQNLSTIKHCLLLITTQNTIKVIYNHTATSLEIKSGDGKGNTALGSTFILNDVNIASTSTPNDCWSMSPHRVLCCSQDRVAHRAARGPGQSALQAGPLAHQVRCHAHPGQRWVLRSGRPW